MHSLKRGFTLVEILVVVAIMGVLSSIGVLTYSSTLAKARDSKRIQDLKMMATSLEAIRNLNNGSGYVSTPTTDCNADNSNLLYTDEVFKSYMKNQAIPADPKTSEKYCYYSANNFDFNGKTYGVSYRLFAKLEDCTSSNVYTQGNCQPNTWNYSQASDDLTLAPAGSDAVNNGNPGGSLPSGNPGGGTGPTPQPGQSTPTPNPAATPTPSPTPVPTPTPTPTPVPVSCPSSGLIAYWKMNESSWVNDCGTTSVIDSSGNGLNGAVCNGTAVTTGILGNAGDFSRSRNNFISVANSDLFNFGTGNFTISLWFKTSSWGSSGAYAGFLSKYYTGGTTWNLVNIEGLSLVFFGFRSGDATGVFDQRVPASTMNSYADGRWHHLVAQRDGDASAKIYIDTTALGSPNQGYNNGGDLGYSAAVPVYIGNYGPVSPNDTAFTGALDEVGMWNRALTTSEIATLYNSGRGLTCR